MEKDPYNYTLLKPIQEEQDEEEEEESLQEYIESIFTPCIYWYEHLPCCSIYMMT